MAANQHVNATNVTFERTTFLTCVLQASELHALLEQRLPMRYDSSTRGVELGIGERQRAAARPSRRGLAPMEPERR